MNFTSSSSWNYRYTRWDIGFTNPPLMLTSKSRTFEIVALNERGKVLLPAIYGKLLDLQAVASISSTEGVLSGTVKEGTVSVLIVVFV
jgi:anthranilate synthase